MALLIKAVLLLLLTSSPSLARRLKQNLNKARLKPAPFSQNPWSTPRQRPKKPSVDNNPCAPLDEEAKQVQQDINDINEAVQAFKAQKGWSAGVRRWHGRGHWGGAGRRPWSSLLQSSTDTSQDPKEYQARLKGLEASMEKQCSKQPGCQYSKAEKSCRQEVAKAAALTEVEVGLKPAPFSQNPWSMARQRPKKPSVDKDPCAPMDEEARQVQEDLNKVDEAVRAFKAQKQWSAGVRRWRGRGHWGASGSRPWSSLLQSNENASQDPEEYQERLKGLEASMEEQCSKQPGCKYSKAEKTCKQEEAQAATLTEVA